jgi:hypothetical protein
MAEMLFYERPVPLSNQKHADWRLKLSEKRFEFAKSINSVVLAGIEFVEASKDYPIVFAEAGEQLVPVALLGLRDTGNIYVDAEGNWLEDHYVPAFVRRYPFVLGEGPGPEPMVCIDEAYSGFGTEAGDLLFEDGAAQPVLTQAMKFLGEFQRQFERTKGFVSVLQSEALLTQVSATIQDEAEHKTHLQGLLVVDEKRLLALSDEQALKLLRSGELSWIYAHLMSISNLKRLTGRAQQR